MRAARHTPGVLEQVGYHAPSAAPVDTLPNGVALYRWPPHYLTPAVHTFVRLWRLSRGRAVADGGVLSWSNWLADAVSQMDAQTAQREAMRDA